MLEAANRQFYSATREKQSENTTSQRPTKRPRENTEETTPIIIVN